MTAAIKPLDIGPFAPGVDNRRPEFKMRGGKEDGGDFLRSAVNVDLSNAGTVKRRSGYVRSLAGADCHSFWSDGSDAFMVDGQTLKRIAGLPGTPVATTLRADLTPGRPITYARAPQGVYFSNGIVIGRIDKDGAQGVSTPSLAVTPTVSVVSGGSLEAGRYGLCFTHLSASGEESASTTPVWLDVAAGSLLRVTNMPLSLPAGAVSTVAYITLPNDSTLQRLLTFGSVAAFDLPVMPWTLGARCQTVLRAPMPAGDIVRYHTGRLLSASGSTLFYSDPYMLGLFNPTAGFIQFPSPITVMEPNSGGVWVCSDQTYWLPGFDIAAANPDPVLPYGGVAGSGAAVLNTNDVFWMSPRGVVRGSQAGVATNTQEAHVAVGAAGFAAGFFREVDGNKQIAQSTFAVEPNRMAAASYMEAEISRKEVTL